MSNVAPRLKQSFLYELLAVLATSKQRQKSSFFNLVTKSYQNSNIWLYVLIIFSYTTLSSVNQEQQQQQQ